MYYFYTSILKNTSGVLGGNAQKGGLHATPIPHTQTKKITFFKNKFLDDISPFCGVTDKPVMD